MAAPRERSAHDPYIATVVRLVGHVYSHGCQATSKLAQRCTLEPPTSTCGILTGRLGLSPGPIILGSSGSIRPREPMRPYVIPSAPPDHAVALRIYLV